MRFSTLRPSFLAVLLGFSLFSFPHFPAKTASDWVFKHEKSGIKVYYKDEGTGIYDLKLVTTVEASLHAVAALLTDVEAYPKWAKPKTAICPHPG